MERARTSYNMFNTKCMEQCTLLSEESCSADCQEGYGDYQQACNQNNGAIVLVTQAADYSNGEHYRVRSLYCLSN